jgi:hypothetical protein
METFLQVWFELLVASVQAPLVIATEKSRIGNCKYERDLQHDS